MNVDTFELIMVLNYYLIYVNIKMVLKIKLMLERDLKWKIKC